MNRLPLAFLALLCLAAGGTTLAIVLKPKAPEPDSTSERILPKEPLEDFQLMSHTGKRFDSRSLEGKIWIASFFFASCPATCRQQNEAIAALQREYGGQGVKFVAISVDPARDTPDALSAYAQGFGAEADTWYFLTDSESRQIDYTRRIGVDVFQVPVTTQGHADTLILVNKAGEIEDYYNWKKSERMLDLRSDIETLLAGKPLIDEDEEGEAETQEAEAVEEAAAAEASTEGSPAE